VGKIRTFTLTSRIQINPRTLPALAAGENELIYRSGRAAVRKAVPLQLRNLTAPNLRVFSEAGQELLCPESGAAEKVVALDATAGFDFAARFLEIRAGLAPDKLTAETRATHAGDRSGVASLSWSLAPGGPWREAWTFPASRPGEDGEKIDRVLRWPEASFSVRDIPPGTSKVYVRVQTSGPCIDNVRAATWHKGDAPAGKLRITHSWTENGAPRKHTEIIGATTQESRYRIKAGAALRNESLTFEALQ
jgi:hypothetical protein